MMLEQVIIGVVCAALGGVASTIFALTLKSRGDLRAAFEKIRALERAVFINKTGDK